MNCYACDAFVAANTRDDHLYLCRSCWLKVVRPGRELAQVLAAITMYKTDPGALDREDYRDLKLLGLWPRLGADADLICDELNKRSEFDKQFRPALMQQLAEPDAQERHRLTTMAAEEIHRRLAFDEKHPRIYRTGQERHQAYAVFLPPGLTEDDWDEAWPGGGTGRIFLPFGQPEQQKVSSQGSF